MRRLNILDADAYDSGGVPDACFEGKNPGAVAFVV